MPGFIPVEHLSTWTASSLPVLSDPHYSPRFRSGAGGPRRAGACGHTRDASGQSIPFLAASHSPTRPGDVFTPAGLAEDPYIRERSTGDALEEAGNAMNARWNSQGALCAPARARGMSDVRIEELARLANRADSGSAHARNIALALRTAIKNGKAGPEACLRNQYMGDTEIRRHMDAALEQLSLEEIQAMVCGFLVGPAATKAELHYLKDLVERQGRGGAEHAMLGRRFTILCEAVAAYVPPDSREQALEALYVWDWHPNLSRHVVDVARPGRLSRAGSALYRGLRHWVMAGLAPEEVAKDRVRDARTGLSQAAFAFMQAYARAIEQWNARGLPRPGVCMHNPHELDQAASYLERVKKRYETECAALGEDKCHALRMPTHCVRVYEMAFLDALSSMSGYSVNLLGRYCAGLAYEEMPSASPFAHLVRCMRNALYEERAIRAGAEVVHALVQYMAHWGGTSSFARVFPRLGTPQYPTRTGLNSRPGGSAYDSPLQQEVRARNALLDHIRTLSQRYRLRERLFMQTPVWTITDFVRVGVERLPAPQQHHLQDAICDPEWRLPELLAGDELALGLIRAFQPDNRLFSLARLCESPGTARIYLPGTRS